VRQKTFGNDSAATTLSLCEQEEREMATFVGPNGRLYRRKRSKAKWIGIAMAAMTAAGLAFVMRGIF
jgi:hypothetical protein